METWLLTSQTETSSSFTYVHFMSCFSFISNASPKQATNQPPNEPTNYPVLHSPYQAANIPLVSQEISCISWNQRFISAVEN